MVAVVANYKMRVEGVLWEDEYWQFCCTAETLGCVQGSTGVHRHCRAKDTRCVKCGCQSPLKP